MVLKTEEPAAAKADSQNVWQLQHAKARFSEVFRLALEKGPQRVTRHGKEAVVVLCVEEFDRLKRRKVSQQSLAKFFAESPLAGSGIEFKRDKDLGRVVKL